VRETIPFRKRPFDWLLLGFFAINFFFITYIVDIEQLTIADPDHFTYPIWPPAIFVDLVHWWGRNFDPCLMAREPWWRATIWIDAVLFGPFYAAAMYALVKGKEWIRVPAFVWAGLMFANVTIIMFEELLGPHHTPTPWIVIGANIPWWTLPAVVTFRFARSEHAFSRAN
jgi:hypothetical protein